MRCRSSRLAAVLLLGSLVSCSKSPLAPSPAPSPAASRDGRWIQDVEQLAKDLPRLHPNLFFSVSREAFERETETLKADVTRLADHQVVVRLMRLAALPGDGHTSVGGAQWGGFRRLPLRLRWLSDGLVVTAAAQSHRALLGARVRRLGGADASELLSRVTPVVSHDNDAAVKAQSPDLLAIPEVLHALGVVTDPETVPLAAETQAGAGVVAEVRAVSRSEVPELVDATTAASNPLPLYRQHPQDFYWYTRLEAADVLYLQYNRCQNGAETMSAFSQRFFRDLDGRPPRGVVIDLRANPGGDSSVADPLLQGLRSRRHLADARRLYGVTGGATFSSALMNAVTLKREAGAILVGEPTGGRPNHYGQVSSFALPNSAVTVYYSTRFFRLLTDSDPAALYPDLLVEPSSADYVAGRDPVLEAILARLP